MAWIKLNADPKAGGHLWVLDADIKGCFDNLAHESILERIGSIPRGDLIKEWMKAGYVYEGVHNPTETGTPQGGIVSPLLSNIGLHGLEQAVKSWCPKLGIIRYADDFIITGKTREQIEAIETHHIVPVKNGGSDDIENLIHLHSACHKQVHSQSKLKV
jgi:RNA-directed DNA polymerase